MYETTPILIINTVYSVAGGCGPYFSPARHGAEADAPAQVRLDRRRRNCPTRLEASRRRGQNPQDLFPLRGRLPVCVSALSPAVSHQFRRAIGGGGGHARQAAPRRLAGRPAVTARLEGPQGRRQHKWHVRCELLLFGQGRDDVSFNAGCRQLYEEVRGLYGSRHWADQGPIGE